jgi:hypothetical protein
VKVKEQYQVKILEVCNSEKLGWVVVVVVVVVVGKVCREYESLNSQKV